MGFPVETMLPTARMRKFRAHPLGLFLHWGIYAIEAWQEQDCWRRTWAKADYEAIAQRFTASRFDPDAWIDAAAMLGADYLVLTAKHIDGFCLWDTATTRFNSAQAPLGRDVVREFTDACRRRGVACGLYLSVVDNHQPSYPHAGRRWERPAPLPGDQASRAAYLAVLTEQVRELCSNYGRLHALWWDGNIAQWHDPAVNALARKLQPGILINNRGLDAGDFGTPERDWGQDVDRLPAFPVATEACQSLGSQSWGHRIDEDYYTIGHLQRSIAKVLSKGGNYLLNTGPQADGTIAATDRRMLRELGDWYRIAREALLCKPSSHLTVNREITITRRDARTWFVILHRIPHVRSIPLKPLVTLPVRAIDLRSGTRVQVRNDLQAWDHQEGIGYTRLYNLDERVLSQGAPVIRLDFDETPRFNDRNGNSQHDEAAAANGRGSDSKRRR